MAHVSQRQQQKIADDKLSIIPIIMRVTENNKMKNLFV